MSKYIIVLSLTDSNCERDSKHECIISAVGFDSRKEAREAIPKLQAQGFTTHFITIRPVEDYL